MDADWFYGGMLHRVARAATLEAEAATRMEELRSAQAGLQEAGKEAARLSGALEAGEREAARLAEQTTRLSSELREAQAELQLTKDGLQRTAEELQAKGTRLASQAAGLALFFWADG